MMRYIFDLNIDKKLLLVSLIIIIFLITKNIIFKKRLSGIKLKLNILEQQKKEYGEETELDKITKKFLELSKSDQENKQDDFENWVDNAEIGETYHFKSDKK